MYICIHTRTHAHEQQSDPAQTQICTDNMNTNRIDKMNTHTGRYALRKRCMQTHILVWTTDTHTDAQIYIHRHRQTHTLRDM